MFKRRYVPGEKPGRWDNIKKDLSETECEDMDYFHVSRDTVHKRFLVNTAMNLRVPEEMGSSRKAEILSDFHAGLCSMHLTIWFVG